MDKLPTSKLARFCPKNDAQEREDPENHPTEVVRSGLGSEDVFHILLDSDKHQAPKKGWLAPMTSHPQCLELCMGTLRKVWTWYLRGLLYRGSRPSSQRLDTRKIKPIFFWPRGNDRWSIEAAWDGIFFGHAPLIPILSKDVIEEGIQELRDAIAFMCEQSQAVRRIGVGRPSYIMNNQWNYEHCYVYACIFV